MIQFELPNKTSSIIKVIGVGGGGGNAVNYMNTLGIEGVDFVLANTDAKALEQSTIANKIQIGPSLTQGLGAGANPEVGQKACEESIAEIGNILMDNTKMVFVTAGMGGGTGTGGAPIVAKAAKDLGILTVGIVTTPFSHEGKKRMKQAEEGIAKMRESVDTILVISNDKLRQSFGNLGFREAFSKADDILATATKCITDVINSRGHVIVDFADVCTVMRNGGVAILGSAYAAGEDRAAQAVQMAISSPLLNDHDIKGAKWVLLNITSSEGEHEHTLDEMDVIQNYIQLTAGEDCDVILGTGYDNTLGEALGVTIIATGFNTNDINKAFAEKPAKPEDIKVLRNLDAPAIENTPQAEAKPEIKNEIETNAPIVELSNNINTTEGPLKVELAPTAFVPEQPAVPAFNGMGFRPATVVTQNVATEKPAEKVVFNLEEPIGNEAPIVKQQEATPIASNAITSTTSELADDFITMDGVTINRKVGSRYLTDNEVLDKITFELEKKAFEDRASKLRGISHNFGVGTSNDQMENVPAFMRAGKPLPENESANTELSGYKVDGTNQIDGTDTYLGKHRPC